MDEKKDVLSVQRKKKLEIGLNDGEFHTVIAGNDNEAFYCLSMMRPDQLSNDVGYVLEGHENVEIGLIDEVGSLDKTINALRKMTK